MTTAPCSSVVTLSFIDTVCFCSVLGCTVTFVDSMESCKIAEYYFYTMLYVLLEILVMSVSKILRESEYSFFETDVTMYSEDSLIVC